MSTAIPNTTSATFFPSLFFPLRSCADSARSHEPASRWAIASARADFLPPRASVDSVATVRLPGVTAEPAEREQSRTVRESLSTSGGASDEGRDHDR